jgi:hypothetical protein
MSYSIPDLVGWQAYCEECETFREVSRARERNAVNNQEYFEFVCTECGTILLTFQRANVSERLPVA